MTLPNAYWIYHFVVPAAYMISNLIAAIEVTVSVAAAATPASAAAAAAAMLPHATTPISWSQSPVYRFSNYTFSLKEHNFFFEGFNTC